MSVDVHIILSKVFLKMTNCSNKNAFTFSGRPSSDAVETKTE